MSEGASTTPDLEQIYRREGPRLWRALFLSTGDRDITDDAVAEAFAQALRRGEAIRSPAAWVWKAAFRIAAGELKERARRAEPTREERYDIREDPADLMAMLACLSPRQRQVVVLHCYVGYRQREVAQIIGSTTSAVGVHLHRARARLREALETESSNDV